MQNFNYKAKDVQTGQLQKGEVKANNAAAAAKALADRNLAPISIKAEGDGLNLSFIGRIRTKDKVIFSRQLSTLISSGLPLTQGLRIVQDQINNQKLQNMVSEIIADVESGSTLADSMAKHPKGFSTVYVSLIAAGETSGTLDESLERLADQQEKDAEVTSKIRGALTYPLIVLLVIGGVLGFLLTAVVPQVALLYEDLDTELPIITKIMIFLSNAVSDYWWLLLILLGGFIFLAVQYVKTEAGRAAFDKFKMRVPVVGNLFMKLYMNRFASTGATLLASGVPLLQSISVTAKAVGNVHVAESLRKAGIKIQSGTPLSDALEGDKNFLELVPQMIKIGEQSGSVKSLLNRVADYYEKELDNQIKTISTIIEPVLMVFMALIAGFAIGAILIPIYGLINSANLGA